MKCLKLLLSVTVACIMASSAQAETQRKLFSCIQTRTTSIELVVVWQDGESTEPDLIIQEQRLGQVRELARLNRPYSDKENDNFIFKYTSDEGENVLVAINEIVAPSLPGVELQTTFQGIFDISLNAPSAAAINNYEGRPSRMYCSKLY